MNKNTLVLAFSIIIAGAIIAVSIVAIGIFQNDNHSNTENTNNLANNDGRSGLEIGEAPVFGNDDAPITIVEFADFQCPYCALFNQNASKQIVDNYVKTGKAKFVFKSLHFLDGGGTSGESYLSALAAECAKDQGKFWEFHNKIYEAEYEELVNSDESPENNGNLNMSFFKEVASDLNMDVDALESCIDSEKYKEQLDSYSYDAQVLAPTGMSTPTLFINGQKISGARDFSVYKNIIDNLLEK